MDILQFKLIFANIFEKNGLSSYICDEIMNKFAELTEIMLETNAVMNITALTTLEKIIPLHYADCVWMAKYIPQNASVIDIGCGGGFPILPLAIVRPDLHLTGLDSTEKKVRYVQNTANALGLTIQSVTGRAEELSHDTQYRETYDVVISRAVARMNVLQELCLPFARVNGTFLAMKGAAGSEEADEVLKGCKKLGASITQILEYDLHLENNAEKRTMIEFQKILPTPTQYPRAFASIKKKPLS